MPNTKICHYTQQAYLKEWANNPKRTNIWFYDKVTQIFNDSKDDTKSIQKIAQIPYLYPQWLEDWFNQDIEQKGINDIKKLIRFQDFYSLNNDEQANILNWIYVHIFRNPSFYDILISDLKGTLDNIINEKKHKHPQDFIQFAKEMKKNLDISVEYQNEIKRNIWLKISNKANYDISILQSHKWIIENILTNIGFFTSENPVCFMMDPKDSQKQFNFDLTVGLGKNSQFLIDYKFQFSEFMNYMIPLSPTILLKIQNKKTKNLNQKKIGIKDKSIVSAYNDITIQQSYDYVFSRDKNFYGYRNKVKEICKKFPKELNHHIELNKIESSKIDLKNKIVNGFCNNSEFISEFIDKIVSNPTLYQKISEHFEKVFSDEEMEDLNYMDNITTEKLKIDEIIKKIKTMNNSTLIKIIYYMKDIPEIQDLLSMI